MRAQRVRAGQINQFDRCVIRLEPAHVAFDGHAGIIPDALAQTREPVEQGAFTGIRSPDDRNAGICLPPDGYVFE